MTKSNLALDQKIKNIKDAKKKHFDMLKKNNAITDAKNGFFSLYSMKLFDVLLQLYLEKGVMEFSVELAYLRKKLNLEKNNDYVERIQNYLTELKLPFQMRDFNLIGTGRKISWATASFLDNATSYKDTRHIVDIKVSEVFMSYLLDRAGYTFLDISTTNRFKTKYGYKIYEMFMRYYSLPNKINRNLGTIKQDIMTLNEKFGTTHKYASKMLEGINRGIDEIKEITNEALYCSYDKREKSFVFVWERLENSTSNSLAIPEKLVSEFADWVIEHSKNKIENVPKYKNKIINLIKKNELEDWEELYRGMLMHKYGYTSVEIDTMKKENGKYKHFTKKQKTLFQ